MTSQQFQNLFRSSAANTGDIWFMLRMKHDNIDTKIIFKEARYIVINIKLKICTLTLWLRSWSNLLLKFSSFQTAAFDDLEW